MPVPLRRAVRSRMGLTISGRVVVADTRVDPAKLREIGKAIGGILEEHQSVFNQLSNLDPNAGKFDAAEWLEDLFVDRRDGILAHVKYLKLAFEEINAGLYKIADGFEGVDAANADAVAKFTKSAKEYVAGMADAQFTPTTMQAKQTYDSKDNAPTGDKPGGINLEGTNAKINFNPKDVPGMNDWMKLDGVGPGKQNLDMSNQADLKTQGGFEVPKGPTGNAPPPPTGPAATNNTPPPATNNTPAPAPPSTGANFNAKAEPRESTSREVIGRIGGADMKFRQYDVGGAAQTDAKGRKIVWYNGIPYYPKGGKGSATSYTEYTP